MAMAGGRPFNTGDNWNLAARAADGTVEFLSEAPPRGIYHHYARLSVASFASVSLSGSGTLTLDDLSQPPIAFLNFQASDPSGWPPNFAVTTRANAGNPANFDLEVIYNPAASEGVTLPVTVESFSNLSLNPADPNYAPAIITPKGGSGGSNFVSVPASYVPPAKSPVFPANFSAGARLPGTGTFQLIDTSSPPIVYLTLQTTATAGWPQNFAVTPFGSATNLNLEVVYAPGGNAFAIVERFAGLSLSAIGGQVSSQFITHLISPLLPPFPQLTLIGLPDCRSFWPPTSLQSSPALHVSAINWANDMQMTLGTFQQNLQITIDGPPDPGTVSSSTVIVTMEVPTGTPPLTSISEIIGGTPTTSASVITWTPPTGFAPSVGAGLRVRVTLKGHFIWAQSSNGPIYLDGQAFAPFGPGTKGLPSGSAVRASDFESWFTLVPDTLLQFGGVATSTILRGEGLTEVLGDIVLNGTGGTPTPSNSAVQTVNITVSLNGAITSRLFATSPLQDAVLLIDEPGLVPPLRLGSLNGSSTTPPPQGVGGSGLDFRDGQATNLIVGKFNPSTPNQVTFFGVPIDPPGTGRRILRITNLRANANAQGAGGTGAPAVVVASISVSGSIAVPISPSTYNVGFVAPATSTAVLPVGVTFTIDPSAGVNPALAGNPSATGVVNVQLQFTGTASGVFKPRTVTQGFVPGAPYQAEESLDGTGQSLHPGSPPLDPSMGRADQGTQFVARFQNVPPGVQIFVTTREVPPGGLRGNPDTPPAQAILVTPQGTAGSSPGGVPLGTGGHTSGAIAGIPIMQVGLLSGAAGSSGEAIWEWVGLPQSAIQTLQFGVVLAMAPSGATPAPQTATVRLSLGPLSGAAFASQSDPIPRFADVATVQTLFTLR